MKYFIRTILFILFLSLAKDTNAQYKKDVKTTRILFIFDASNSMNGKWDSGKKIDIARKILIKLVDSLDKLENTQLALRVYGHQYAFPPQVCTDSKLEVPFANENISKIKETLNNIIPKGTTPIAYSLEQSANDFPPRKNVRNVIVLITDGIEACDGDPCAIALALQSKNITLKPYIIGIGLDVEIKKAFECVGKFYDAQNEEEFEDMLEVVVKQTFNKTSAQINLLDITKKPTETNVNLSFYDKNSEKVLFNAIHTMNENNEPDIIYLDPKIDYKIVVHTIPKTIIDNITIIPNKHNIISAPAPQGYLLVKQEKGNKYDETKLIVRQVGKKETLYAQEFGKSEKYLVGTYDIELLTLPRIYKNNIKITQSKTTTIKILQPGLVNFNMPAKGFGSLYVIRNTKQVWVCNLNGVTREVYTLQPGNYRVVWRTTSAKKMDLSKIKDFKVVSGRSVVVKF
ncbi:MAG: von willebrand factor type a [Bacteroidetes bacterium]|nr:MAG: von willebrand factor type a [Bacteroidota bacterium]